jgi:hypothetical protein
MSLAGRGFVSLVIVLFRAPPGFEPEPPGFQEPIFDHRPIFNQKYFFMSWPVNYFFEFLINSKYC